MTQCDKVAAVLTGYVGGDLPPRQVLGVRRHLSGCPACAASVAELREVIHLARSLPRLTPPPAAAARILAALRAAAGRPSDETALDLPLVPSLTAGPPVWPAAAG